MCNFSIPTSDVTTILLKPYVGEAHLISSILFLIKLYDIQSFSFFGSNLAYQKMTEIISQKVKHFFRIPTFETIILDATYLKNEFGGINELKRWIDEKIKASKVFLFYDLFLVEKEILSFSKYIILQDKVYEIDLSKCKI